jgi:hypothetical protein
MRYLVFEKLINRNTPAASMNCGIRNDPGFGDLFLVLVNVHKEEKRALTKMCANITPDTFFIF